MKKAQVYATQKYARISPKKVAIVMDLVRGKEAMEAERVLKFDETKSAKIVLKVLRTAIANAKNNSGLNEGNLFVSDLRVNEGTYFKRGRAASRGRYSPILKRTSHVIVGLSERNK